MKCLSENKGFTAFFLIYLSLLSLCAPLDYTLFPDFGLQLSHSLEPLLQSIGEALGLEQGPRGYGVYSDSLGLYLLFAICIPIALIIQMSLSWASISVQAFLFQTMRLLLICFLALQLGQYGLQKLFMRQFFPLDGKLLFTPLGQLDKDTLFWTTMGTSRLFNHITGGIELLTAALIIIPRFRPYGLILSTLVLGHILLLNLSFNIDVKLLVSLLLSISVLLSFPMLKALYSSMKTRMILLPSDPISGRLKWVYWLMIVLVFLELGLGARSAMGAPNEALEGSLLTRSFTLLNASTNAPTRLHFHGSGYLIEEFEGSIFNPLPMIEDRSVQLILLTEHDESLNYSIRGDSLFLSGTLAGEELTWQLLELDLAQLPLKQDAFRWMAP